MNAMFKVLCGLSLNYVLTATVFPKFLQVYTQQQCTYVRMNTVANDLNATVLFHGGHG